MSRTESARIAAERRATVRGTRQRQHDATYAELVEAVARRQGITKKSAREFVEAFLAVLSETVWRTKRVIVPGLGTFAVKRRKSRRIAMPPGAEPGFMRIESHRVVTCRVAKEWRTRVAAGGER